MKKNPSALLVVLLVLIAVIGGWLGTTSNPSSKENHSSAAKNRSDRERADVRAPTVGSEEWARRLSPPEWVPPIAFSGKGSPSPQIPFPRGKNATRRYYDPQTTDIAARKSSLPLPILALSPQDGRFHLLPEEIDLHTRLARRMVFNTTALDSIVQGNTTRLLAPTVDEEVLTLEFKSVKTRSAHTHTLTGHVVGEESTSDVQFVYHDGVIHGSVARYASGEEIEYRILMDGHMMVREIDFSAMTAVCGKPPETMLEALNEKLSGEGVQIIPQDEGDIEGDTVGGRVIDVVVGYDAGARVADGGYSQIEARIIASVDRMTTAFTNSLISNTELILLGTIEDPNYVYPGASSGDMGEELNDLDSLSDGILDTVSSYATQLGADFVSFVLKDADGSAGIAFRPGRSSITARTYMTSTRITFAHELGHNLGCDHSWGDSSQSNHSHYGWRLDTDGSSATTNDRVRTIMAYDWDWGAGARIPYFSNPAVSYNGAPTGAANGHDVRTNTQGDQRYLQNGLNFTNGTFGFDGTRPTLGANNANTIHTGGGVSTYGATVASNRTTRTAFNVTSPSLGVSWERETTQSVFFTGGDEDDLATIQLYKGGVFQSNLATNRNVATGRSFLWAIPLSQAIGSDYMIRVSMIRNGSTITADSGTFSIIALRTPMVIAQTPAVTPPTGNPVSQLVLTFNRVMNPASFTVADDVVSFTGPGTTDLKPSITSGVWSSGNTLLTLNFPSQSASGSYQLVLGSQIQSSAGIFLDQDQDTTPGESVEDRYTASFSIITIAEAVDTSGLTWTTSVNQPWLPQTVAVNTKDGVDSAQSGAISNNQTSSMETTVTGPGTLTFWWNVSSESSYDYLRFYLNGAEQAGAVAISGIPGTWAQKTITIPTGSQTIRWTYSKDESVVAGSDAGWVDEVVFTPSSAPEITVEQPLATNLTDGSSTINLGSINTGSSSSPVTFTVKNTGSSDLTSLAITKDGTNNADYVVSALGATTLAPAASTTFTVTFSPGAAGSRIAAIHIASNDADENPFDISLTGIGVGPGTLAVTPAGGLTSSGNFGGLFNPASLQYTLNNPGGTSINWTAAKTANWVDLSSTSGTLAAGASTTVTASINSSANTLNIGNFSDTVTFTNTTSGTGNTTRGVSLTVNPAVATVNLSNLLQTYDGSPKPIAATTTPPGLANSVTYAGSATVPTNAGTYAVVATITEPNYTGTASGNLTISKAAQTINFAALNPVLDNAAPFALTATATSGLTVSYNSSNPLVASVSGNTVTVVGLGTTTITATQAGDTNYNAATSVPQTLTVVRTNPLAVTGGPYKVLIGQSLSLNGSASLPSHGETISAYDWDLNNNGTFGDETGSTPVAISFGNLQLMYGMTQGFNTIQLRVTDSANKTSIVATTVELVLALTWDANGTTSGQTNGAGAWLDANKWWDGAANQTWAAGSNAIFGGPNSAGGAVTLASPTSVNAITFNTFTGTYTLGTAGQAITINNGITMNASSGAATISSPITLGGAQTWTNHSANLLTISDAVGNGGHLLSFDGTGTISLTTALAAGGGGITKNGAGRLQLNNAAQLYSGPTIVNGGVLSYGDNSSYLSAANITLNGGVIDQRWTAIFTRALGVGDNQIQITGGASGFSNNNGSHTVRINNNAATEVVWGAANEAGNELATGFFNPSTLVLQSAFTQNNSTLTFDNPIDLNATTRTIQVNAGIGGASAAAFTGVIRTSSGTAGMIKTGGGILILNGTNTYNSDTTISDGILRIGNSTAGTLGNGNYNGNISIANGSTLQIWSTASQTLGGTISGAGDLNKAYGGALTLSTSNTFSGKTSFVPQTTAGFTVNVSSFNSVNGGSPLLVSSSLGAPTTATNGTIDFGSGSAQAGVTLKYTGNGETTSGAGLLKFTSTFTGSGSSANDITLQGSSNGEIVGGLPFAFRNLSKAGNGTWTLGGTVSHTGTTTLSAGKLALGASNVLPNATAVSIASATLDALTFSDTLGTLEVTSNAAVINLGSGAAMAFADSSAIDWTDGTLNITGTFVPGSSLRFGTSNAGLTDTQLGKMAISGYGPLGLNSSGYLSAIPTISGVTASQAITNGTATVTLSGTVSASGLIYPTNGETVSITLNGVTQNATISGGAGGFSVNFNTATLPASGTPYTITYAYAGNGVTLLAAANHSSTALTVLTPYQAWLVANGKSDTPANLREFAFGTTNTGPLVLNPDGTIQTRGQAPIIQTTVGSPIVTLTYARRKNSGCTYNAQFSTDLTTWLQSNNPNLIYRPGAPAQTVTDHGDGMEVVRINFPIFQRQGNGSYVKMQQNYCQIVVTTP
jgi:autotransporter-associated beta strand protein